MLVYRQRTKTSYNKLMLNILPFRRGAADSMVLNHYNYTYLELYDIIRGEEPGTIARRYERLRTSISNHKANIHDFGSRPDTHKTY